MSVAFQQRRRRKELRFCLHSMVLPISFLLPKERMRNLLKRENPAGACPRLATFLEVLNFALADLMP